MRNKLCLLIGLVLGFGAFGQIVNYPYLKEIPAIDDSSISSYYIDSSEIRIGKERFLFKFLVKADSSNIRYVNDEMWLSLDFSFIDTIKVNDKYFLAVNTYNEHISFGLESSSEDGINNGVVFWNHAFKFDKEGEVLYYPRINLEEDFFGNRQKAKIRKYFFESMGCSSNNHD